jgi:hypothetical protein
MTILMSNSTVFTSPSLTGRQGLTGVGISNISFNNEIMTINLTNGNVYTSPNLQGAAGTVSDSQLSSAISTYLTNNPIQSTSNGMTAYLPAEIKTFNVDDFNTSCDAGGRAFSFIRDPLYFFAVNGLFSSLAPKILIKNWTTNSISTMLAGKLVNGSANEFTLYLDLPAGTLKPWLASATKYLNFDQNGMTPVGCTAPYSLFCNNQDQPPTLLSTQLTDTYFWNYIREGFYLACDYVQGYIKLRFYDHNKMLFFNFVGSYTFTNANTYLYQFYNNRPTMNFRNGIIASSTKTINPNLFDLSF